MNESSQLDSPKDPAAFWNRWFRNRTFIFATIAVLFVSAAIVVYQKRYPVEKIRSLIRQGQAAASDCKLVESTTCFEAALKLNDFDSDLKYQTLGNLAIVYARNRQPDKAAKTIEQIKSEFETNESYNSKLELAILASSKDVSKASFERAVELRTKLERLGKLTLDDQNNYLSLAIRFDLHRGTTVNDQLRKEFDNILKQNPNHLGANYNLFRIARNESRGRLRIDDKHLKKCLSISNDPHFQRMMLTNAVMDIDRAAKTPEEFLGLIKKYALIGGSNPEPK